MRLGTSIVSPALEAFALAALQFNHAPLALALHLVAALVGGAAAAASLRKAFGSSAIGVWPLFTVVLAVVPIVGWWGLQIALIAPLRERHEAVAGPEFRCTPLFPDQGHHPAPTAPVCAGGRAALRLAHDSARRLQAVSATRAWPEADALPLLREALRDPSDDVRLLAYALLQGRERGAAERVRRSEDQLSVLVDPRTRTRAAEAQLALVLAGHVQGSAAERAAIRALQHCDQGLHLAPRDATLHLVRGQILLALRKPDAAEEAFERALQHGLPADLVSPYLARSGFEARGLPAPARHERRTA